jgi:surface protein
VLLKVILRSFRYNKWLESITKEQLRDKILKNKDISGVNYSHLIDMSGMFYGCKSLIKVPKLDASKVTNMSHIFFECSILEKVPENFPSYDWTETGSEALKENYPEYFI